jgi:hypothetical protein
VRRFAALIGLLSLIGACEEDGGEPAAGNAGSGTGGFGGSAAASSGGANSGSGGTNPGGSSGSGGQAGAASMGSGGAGGEAGTGSMGSGGAPAGGTGSSSGGTQGAPDGGSPGDSGMVHTKTWIPHSSWTCGMPAGIPPPEAGTLVFEASFTLGQLHDVGVTQYGQRYLTEIKSGTAKGPRIDATFLDRGLDWQLVLSNGAIEVEQVNLLRTTDGVSIYFRNCGAAPDSSGAVRVVPDFEAPSASAYAWLNTGKFVGTRALDVQKRTLSMKIYDVSSVAPPAESLAIQQPTGVSDQSWDCKTASGTRGAVAFTESVGIGAGTVSIGASKRGTRSAIPITGGTASGRVTGAVLSGGADYQLRASSFSLDARYTIRTSDGFFILIRNCGAVGALVPVFETRADSPYAWLNTGRFLSSDPGIAPGAVNITIYQAN